MKQYYGCIPSPKDLRNYRIVATSINLPKQFELKHSHIKAQGSVGSCVAHGISEVLETNDNINYSTGWIYGYRPTGYYQGKGMCINEALKTITNVGYIDNDKFDVNIEMNKAKELVDKDIDKLTELASKKKIKSYAWLNCLDEIKEALYIHKTPVILNIPIDVKGLELDDNNVAIIPTKEEGSHCVVCYGWNETGLMIQNSWGEDWGNKGTFILPYEYHIIESWLIEFEDKKDKQEDITKKPNYYWLRELIMIFVKIIRKMIK